MISIQISEQMTRILLEFKKSLDNRLESIEEECFVKKDQVKSNSVDTITSPDKNAVPETRSCNSAEPSSFMKHRSRLRKTPFYVKIEPEKKKLTQELFKTVVLTTNTYRDVLEEDCEMSDDEPVLDSSNKDTIEIDQENGIKHADDKLDNTLPVQSSVDGNDSETNVSTASDFFKNVIVTFPTIEKHRNREESARIVQEIKENTTSAATSQHNRYVPEIRPCRKVAALNINIPTYVTKVTITDLIETASQETLTLTAEDLKQIQTTLNDENLNEDTDEKMNQEISSKVQIPEYCVATNTPQKLLENPKEKEPNASEIQKGFVPEQIKITEITTSYNEDVPKQNSAIESLEELTLTNKKLENRDGFSTNTHQEQLLEHSKEREPKTLETKKCAPPFVSKQIFKATESTTSYNRKNVSKRNSTTEPLDELALIEKKLTNSGVNPCPPLVDTGTMPAPLLERYELLAKNPLFHSFDKILKTTGNINLKTHIDQRFQENKTIGFNVDSMLKEKENVLKNVDTINNKVKKEGTFAKSNSPDSTTNKNEFPEKLLNVVVDVKKEQDIIREIQKAESKISEKNKKSLTSKQNNKQENEEKHLVKESTSNVKLLKQPLTAPKNAMLTPKDQQQNNDDASEVNKTKQSIIKNDESIVESRKKSKISKEEDKLANNKTNVIKQDASVKRISSKKNPTNSRNKITTKMQPTKPTDNRPQTAPTQELQSDFSKSNGGKLKESTSNSCTFIKKVQNNFTINKNAFLNAKNKAGDVKTIGKTISKRSNRPNTKTEQNKKKDIEKSELSLGKGSVLGRGKNSSKK